MSVIASNCVEICNAPHNTSPSKMLYSFPKAQRFNGDKENVNAPYYNVSGEFLKRATSFGYGSKYDFTKDMPKTPPPTEYQVKSFLQQSKSQKKGFCFGGGRQNMIVTGPLAQTINNKNPGPGSYNIPGTRSRTYYSLKGKRHQEQPDKTPGPGSYQMNASLNKSGSNFYSKFKDHKALRFNNNTQRFRKTSSEFPGPGNYDTSTTQLSSKGRYILSNLQNSKTRTFGSSVRKTLNLSRQTPGPGNYQLPSEFGYYTTKKQFTKQKYLKKQNMQKQNIRVESAKEKETISTKN